MLRRLTWHQPRGMHALSRLTAIAGTATSSGNTAKIAGIMALQVGGAGGQKVVTRGQGAGLGPRADCGACAHARLGDEI